MKWFLILILASMASLHANADGMKRKNWVGITELDKEGFATAWTCSSDTVGVLVKYQDNRVVQSARIEIHHADAQKPVEFFNRKFFISGFVSFYGLLKSGMLLTSTGDMDAAPAKVENPLNRSFQMKFLTENEASGVLLMDGQRVEVKCIYTFFEN